jgi:regulator of replication initiation timing
MSPTPELKKNLKACDPEVQHYVAYLQLENAKLQKRIAKLEVENMTLNNRVRALEIEIKKRPNRTLEEIIAGSME